jgi:hypothetical protein
MAELVQELSVPVREDAGGDYRNPTSFGLPGYGTGHAKYCHTNYTIGIHVYEDLSVQTRINGSFTCNVLKADYPVAFVLNPSDFRFTLSGSNLTYPSTATLMGSTIINVDPGGSGTGETADFVWNLDSGWKNVGHLWDFGASDTGLDGYLWVGGTGTYTVTDPVYPVPVRITVPGFLKYLGYYPWARYGDGKYKSCNRAGGSLMQVRAGAYADVRNSERDHSVDRAFYYTGGKWNSCLEIGAK